MCHCHALQLSGCPMQANTAGTPARTYYSLLQGALLVRQTQPYVSSALGQCWGRRPSTKPIACRRMRGLCSDPSLCHTQCGYYRSREAAPVTNASLHNVDLGKWTTPVTYSEYFTTPRDKNRLSQLAGQKSNKYWVNVCDVGPTFTRRWLSGILSETDSSSRRHVTSSINIRWTGAV